MARSVSIRRSLLVNLVALVAVLGTAVLATSVIAGRRAVDRLSGALIASALDEAEAELERFFEPVDRELRLARDWGRAGLLDLDEPDAINALLVPLLENTPQISAVLVVDVESGREHLLLHLDGRRRERRTSPEREPGVARWREWPAGAGAPRARTARESYDARLRPWFRGALADAPDVHWTAPYVFFTTDEPGMTTSASFRRPDGSRGMIALDVDLEAVSGFADAVRTTPRGLTFVATRDLRLIGVPAAAAPAPGARREALLRRPVEAGLGLLDDLTASLGREDLGARRRRAEPLRFRSGGQAWWGSSRDVRRGAGDGLVVAVVVPESDLLGTLPSQRATVLGLTVAVLLLAVLRAAAMARRYSRPIEALVAESLRIGQGDLEPGPPMRPSVREIATLAQAHQRMREALRSLLKLEGDLQLARQIQRSTFPEVMPEVPDYAVDAWSEPAEATGGDTYDVIGLRAGPSGPEVVEGEAERLFLLLADATGHGVGPSLSVTQVRAMLRMAVRGDADLAAIARHMNEQLCRDLHGGRFVTAWLGELEASAHRLNSFSAGQAPILHWEAHTGTCHELPADTAPLGILPLGEDARPQTIELAPGDLVAVISDGVFEAEDPDGRAFGLERVVEVLRAAGDAPPGELLARLRESLAVFTCGHPADDDRTAIVVKRAPATLRA